MKVASLKELIVSVVEMMIIRAIKVRIVLSFVFQLGVWEDPERFIVPWIIRIINVIGIHISAHWVHEVIDNGHCSLDSS